MNIVREQRGENNSLIRVTVGEADYGQEVEKSLREYKRKANIPGFRPGMVPMGIVKKMYGKGVLAEQSYRQASNAVFEYLQKEGIDYLGDVIPAEEQGDFDFDNATEFEFVFEIGEAPEIKLELSDKDKLTYNKIKVDKKMHDDYRSNYLRRFGRLVDAEKVTSDEALSVTLDNGEMNVADAYVGLISMDEADRKPFIGKKVGDKMKVNINELYKNPAQRAACLQVKENELEGVNPEFELEITKIRKFAEPELNEEFFKMAFPQGGVTDEAGLDKFIDAQIEAELRRESDYLFTLQVRDYLVKKADLKMPAAFQALALHDQRGVLDGGHREGFRPVPEDVHLKLLPEALHQDRRHSVSRRRRLEAKALAARSLHSTACLRRRTTCWRVTPRRFSPTSDQGPEDLREALSEVSRIDAKSEGQGNEKAVSADDFAKLAKEFKFRGILSIFGLCRRDVCKVLCA